MHFPYEKAGFEKRYPGLVWNSGFQPGLTGSSAQPLGVKQHVSGFPLGILSHSCEILKPFVSLTSKVDRVTSIPFTRNYK